jgi:putative hydrolase of the HAD superfamily
MVDLFCGKSERYLHRNAGLLRRWGSRLRLGLVSNFYGNVETVCNEHGLGVSLKVILDSARFGKKKPAPDIFQAALEQLELPPEQTLFVGDSYERDLMPARRLGMKTAWLRGPFPRLPADPEPVDVCLDTLTDLERMIS